MRKKELVLSVIVLVMVMVISGCNCKIPGC